MTNTMRDLPEKHLLDYLFGSLEKSALQWESIPHAIEQGMGWFQAIAGRGNIHLPLFFIFDLGWVLQLKNKSPWASEKRYEQWSRSERSLRIRYENEFLDRIIREKNVQKALKIIARSSSKTQKHLHLLKIISEKCSSLFPKKIRMNPAHLRTIQSFDLKHPTTMDYLDRFYIWNGQSGFFLHQIESFLTSLSSQFLWKALVLPEDLFELEHLDTLSSESKRIACRHILKTCQAFEKPIHLSQIKRNQPRQRHHALLVQEEGRVGGFSELTNNGSFESMIASEMVFMGDGKEVDLFDIRYLEKELLFYQRDIYPFREKRREIHILLDINDVFDIKTNGYPVRFSALIQGFLIRIIRDLSLLFSKHSFRFFISSTSQKPIKTDQSKHDLEMLRLLLFSEIKQKIVVFQDNLLFSVPSLKSKTSMLNFFVITDQSTNFWETEIKNHRIHEQSSTVLHIMPSEYSAKQFKHNSFLLPTEGLNWSKLRELKNTLLYHLVGRRI